MTDFDALRALDPSAFAAALDAFVREHVGEESPRRLSVYVDRTGDDAFDVEITIDPPAPEAGPYPTPIRAKLGGVDLPRTHAAVSWAAGRAANVAQSSRKWPKWKALTLEDRVREIARVLEAAPACVIVACLPPSSERGEPPTGQPNIVIDFGRSGLTFKEYLVLAMTSPADHEEVSNRVIADGNALATALGVPCNVVR